MHTMVSHKTGCIGLSTQDEFPFGILDITLSSFLIKTAIVFRNPTHQLKFFVGLLFRKEKNSGKITHTTLRSTSFFGTSNADGQWPPFFVCNPFMSDYVVVKHPRSTELGDCIRRHAGFGYSFTAGQYKLLRFFSHKKTNRGFGDIDESLVAEVYTMGSDEPWRILDNRPPQGYYWSAKGTILEGSPHWLIIHLKTNASTIVAFNCQEEVFVLVDLPNGLTHEPMKTANAKMYLTTLQSRLCFCIWDKKETKDCDIWVMDEHGVSESWRKLFVVSSGGSPDHLMPLKPLAYLDNGEVLMLSDTGELVSYDVTSNRWRAIKVPGVSSRVKAMLLDPIFLPTRNILLRGAGEQPNDHN